MCFLTFPLFCFHHFLMTVFCLFLFFFLPVSLYCCFSTAQGLALSSVVQLQVKSIIQKKGNFYSLPPTVCVAGVHLQSLHVHLHAFSGCLKARLKKIVGNVWAGVI